MVIPSWRRLTAQCPKYPGKTKKARHAATYAGPAVQFIVNCNQLVAHVRVLRMPANQAHCQINAKRLATADTLAGCRQVSLQGGRHRERSALRCQASDLSNSVTWNWELWTILKSRRSTASQGMRSAETLFLRQIRGFFDPSQIVTTRPSRLAFSSQLANRLAMIVNRNRSTGEIRERCF